MVTIVQLPVRVYTCMFCKCTAANTRVRFVFNMMWSYRNRGSTCLSYTMEEWTQLKWYSVRRAGGAATGRLCLVCFGGKNVVHVFHTYWKCSESRAPGFVRCLMINWEIGVSKLKISCYCVFGILKDRCVRGHFCVKWVHGIVYVDGCVGVYMCVCLPDVSSRLKAILTSDLSGDTLLVEVIIYPFMRPQAQNRAVSTIKRISWKTSDDAIMAWLIDHVKADMQS